MGEVWRYPITGQGMRFEFKMPHGARVLTVQMKDGEPNLWALVDPANAEEPRAFAIVGTGHRIPDPSRHDYLGTFQQEGTALGTLVWHVFEIKPDGGGDGA